MINSNDLTSINSPECPFIPLNCAIWMLKSINTTPYAAHCSPRVSIPIALVILGAAPSSSIVAGSHIGFAIAPAGGPQFEIWTRDLEIGSTEDLDTDLDTLLCRLSGWLWDSEYQLAGWSTWDVSPPSRPVCCSPCFSCIANGDLHHEGLKWSAARGSDLEILYSLLILILPPVSHHQTSPLVWPNSLDAVAIAHPSLWRIKTDT